MIGSYIEAHRVTLEGLPSNTTLPWHRVINAKGEISFPMDSEAHIKQRSRLKKEGIEFENGRVSMRVYGWSI